MHEVFAKLCSLKTIMPIFIILNAINTYSVFTPRPLGGEGSSPTHQKNFFNYPPSSHVHAVIYFHKLYIGTSVDHNYCNLISYNNDQLKLKDNIINCMRCLWLVYCTVFTKSISPFELSVPT